jgi:hypothetical protein
VVTATGQTSRIPWTVRMAGVLVAGLGSANAVFGVLSLTTDLVRLTGGAAVGLLVLGAVTVVIAVPVWRGSPTGVTVALTAFGLLLVVQLGEVASSPGSQTPVARLVVLGIVVLALGVARGHLWRTARG